MRKSKIVDVGGKQIEVREITLREALDLKDRFSNVNDVRDLLADVAARWTSVTLDDLIDLAPSELKALWLAFQDVNGDFFAAAQWLGLDQTVIGIVNQMRKALRNSTLGFVGLATDPPPSTTD
jgi:hypothetical protein